MLNFKKISRIHVDFFVMVSTCGRRGPDIREGCGGRGRPLCMYSKRMSHAHTQENYYSFHDFTN